MIWFRLASPMYTPSMRPLYERLREDSNEVYWAEPPVFHEEDFHVICNLPNRYDTGSWEHCIFVPHSVSEYFPYKYPDAWNFKLRGVLSVGPVTDKLMRDHPICDDRVKMVGWPRGDILFSQEKDKVAEQLKKSLNLPYEKTVLIICASTGHLQEEISILNEILPQSKGRFNILIKERGTKYSNLVSDRQHIKCIDTAENITPYYLVTDLLLSIHPASSTLMEICQVNKPSISLNFGDGDVNDWLGKWKYCFLGRADVYSNLKTLNSDIMALLEDDPYIDGRKKKLEQFIYKPDGHATERGVKALKEFFE